MPQRAPRGASAKYKHLYKLKAYVLGRVEFLAKHPWCVLCEQRSINTPATVVNHKIPHKGDKRLFLDKSNWQPVCEHCHNSHCKRQDAGLPMKGCDANGNPLDRSHPWYQER